MNKFLNHYHCPKCEHNWTDESECTNNDKCPGCNSEIEPHQSDDLTIKMKEQMLNDIQEGIRKSPVGPKLSEADLASVAAAVLDTMEGMAESVEGMFNMDEDEDEQLQAIPIPWV